MKNAICILAILAAIPCRARTITVDDDSPADFNNIQAAIDDANDADTVEIQPGTYTGPGNRDISLLGKAITVTGTDPNDPNIVAQTIIDCNATQADQHRGFSFSSGESHDAVLQGLTITGGYIVSHGGAILCDSGSSPTIRSCIILGNTVETTEDGNGGAGGGIYCSNQSNPLIDNCTIANNAVIGNYPWNGSGGGICCQESSPSIINCTVIGNTTTASGGGISFSYYSSPIIADCIISDNNAADNGGGLACGANNRDAGAKISRCIITGNTAAAAGGIFSASDYSKFNDCVIAGNTATDDGGGIGTWVTFAVFTNCTIANNTAASGGGLNHTLGYLSLYNCILWGNSAPEGPQLTMRYCHAELPTGLIAEYNNIQGGRDAAYLPQCDRWELDTELGNIDVEPGFVDPANMDFRLRPDSWCIDKGANDYANDTDILGNPRIIDGDGDRAAFVDMGAYEAIPANEPVIEFSTPELHISADQNDPDPQPQTAAIRNRGPGDLNWTLAADCPWLSFVPNEGTSTTQSDEITFSVNVDGLTPATHDCNLIITAPLAVNSPKSVPVKLHVLGALVRVPGQFPTIQDGIDHASEGGSVVVADGLYTGSGNRNIDFKGKPITVRSENGPANCVIDCQGTFVQRQRGFHFQNGENETSVVDGFTVINASGESKGVAVYCQNSGPTITNCRIIDNPGGGIHCEDQSSPLIGNCLISGNRPGGVICIENSSPTIANCVISSNDQYLQSRGIYCDGSRPTITNCTIVANYNYAIDCDYGAHAVVKNCIIRENAINLDGGSDAEVMYSNVQGGYTGVGNIGGDPRLVASGHWEDPCNTPEQPWDDVWVDSDYHLKSKAGRYDPNTETWVIDEVTSPCIDAGEPFGPTGHEPFPNGGIVNMGAYGGTIEATKSYFGQPPCETIVAGDVNGDCVVNFLDFRFIALHWLTNNTP